jgi:hypothetical protein
MGVDGGVAVDKEGDVMDGSVRGSTAVERDSTDDAEGDSEAALAGVPWSLLVRWFERGEDVGACAKPAVPVALGRRSSWDGVDGFHVVRTKADSGFSSSGAMASKDAPRAIF